MKTQLDEMLKPNYSLLIGMATFLLYPLHYEVLQFLKLRTRYLNKAQNKLDCLQITMGYYSIYNQIKYHPLAFSSKVVMIVTIFLCLMKTFYFLRIVKKFSFIVTMLVNVVLDLSVFMVFFSLVIIMSSLIFDVLYKDHSNKYRNLSPFFANLFITLELSLGSFNFDVL